MAYNEEMGWMPLSPDGIAMCQTRGVEAQAEREGIHGGNQHHRRRSDKERVPGSRRRGGKVRSVVTMFLVQVEELAKSTTYTNVRSR